jgi:hypothetical protein
MPVPARAAILQSNQNNADAIRQLLRLGSIHQRFGKLIMAASMQDKLEKVVNSGTGTRGKNLPGQKEPKCVTGPAKSGATCNKKNKKKIVTSVGS